MTGLELFTLGALFALFLVIPIGAYLELGGDATDANEFTKFIETNELGSDI